MSEIVPITMPKFGLSMEEGMVAAWHAAEGDEIQAGEEIVDIETTKITSAFESPTGGTLRRHVIAEGETVPVGALIAVVADASVADGDIQAFIAEFQARFQPASTTEAEAGGPEAQTVATAAGSLRYLEWGAGDGSPVVFVHGFGGDLDNWMFVQPQVAADRRTLALDLPGHGGSTKEVGDGDPAALSDALEGLLAALSVDAAHLVAHSLGSAVALELARRSPARVRSLTLISPAGLGPDINMDYIQGFVDARRRKELKPVVELLFADPSLVSRDLLDDLLKYKRLDGVPDALHALVAGCFDGGRQAASYRDALAHLEMPVQVIWGRDDRIIPASHADDLPERVRLERLDDTGHMAHMERAGIVIRLVEEAADS